MPDGTTDDVRTSYDRAADEYAARLFGELAHKPLDRILLDQFAERVRGKGPACDLGCGPGQVARYLRDRGVDVTGIDLSPGMVATARRLNPDVPFAEGDLRALPVADGAFAGVAAFYSIIHVPRPEVVDALAEIRRVLRPGGLLLLAFHVGDDHLHRDELCETPVSLDFVFFRSDEMTVYLSEAGFTAIEAAERDPYPEVEYPSRRAYLFAENPPEGS